MKRAFTIRMFAGVMALVLSQWTGSLLKAQTTHNVSVTNNDFTPDELTISAGDEVLWINSEGEHNVNGTTGTYPDNPESFGNNVGSGWSYSYVFNTPGVYDYHCDPHLAQGMTGKIIVEAVTLTLTINFTGMTPHVGQDLWLRVENDDTNEEIYRSVHTVSESFQVEVTGIESGNAYEIEFFADHNGNGHYDAPSGDHAWRIMLEDVSGNETIDFIHNTNFTDIEWKHRLRVEFFGMTPHIGQMLKLYVKDRSDGMLIDSVTIAEVPGAEFDIEAYGIIPGSSYSIDFYADHNLNGSYDAPPADHAWRIVLLNTEGDEEIEFTHNTEFTDIESEATSVIADRPGAELKVYPNPAISHVYVETGSLMESVSLYTLSGAIIRSVQDVQSERIRLPMNDISPGVYILKVHTVDKAEEYLKILRD